MFFRTDGAPSPVSTERQSRTRRPPSCHCGPAVFLTFEEKVPRGADPGNAKRTRKRSTLRVLFFARKNSETVSDELCKATQKQQHKTFCMWLEKVKKTSHTFNDWIYTWSVSRELYTKVTFVFQLFMKRTVPTKTSFRKQSSYFFSSPLSSTWTFNCEI